MQPHIAVGYLQNDKTCSSCGAFWSWLVFSAIHLSTPSLFPSRSSSSPPPPPPLSLSLSLSLHIASVRMVCSTTHALACVNLQQLKITWPCHNLQQLPTPHHVHALKHVLQCWQEQAGKPNRYLRQPATNPKTTTGRTAEQGVTPASPKAWLARSAASLSSPAAATRKTVKGKSPSS